MLLNIWKFILILYQLGCSFEFKFSQNSTRLNFNTLYQEVKSLSERMRVIRQDLAEHVTLDFQEAFSTSSRTPVNFENIRNACLVADSLDSEVKIKLINNFIESRLSEYKLLFDISQGSG